MKRISKTTFVSAFGAMVFALVTVFAIPTATVGAVAAPAAPAVNCDTGASGGAAAGVQCAQGADVPDASLFGSGSIFTNVVNVLLFIIGALSVVMLIWGGIRYTTSGGQAASVTAAKNTIMYAIIGLIVAFLAFAIVNWVLTAL